MEISVLGRYGPYPAKGGCCAGYLVWEKNCRILIDCGNGVLSRLHYYLNCWELDAVILSHLHADHVSDIYIMRYALDIGRTHNRHPLPLYAPEEPASEFQRLPYKEVYDVRPIVTGQDLQIGPFTLSFMPTIHPVPCFAISIQAEDKKLVYSSDTEFNQNIILFSKGADLLLCEANFLQRHIEMGLPNHLSAGQAGCIARKAMVKKLLLTHLSPQNKPELSLEEARAEFPDAVIAEEGVTYTV